MNFSLPSEHKMLRDAVREFASNEIAPIADELEEKEEYPLSLHKKCGELGFIGSFIPEKYGGGGMGYLSRAIIDEEFSKVLSGFAMSLQSSALYGGNNILKFGQARQKEKYLPGIISGDLIACWALTEPEAGSDAFGIQSTARKDGNHYILNGLKTFITNAPIADIFIVITKTSEERKPYKRATAFILEKGMPGLTTGKPIKKLGHKSSPTSEIFFKDLKVHKDQILGREGEGFSGMLAHLDVERILGAPSITDLLRPVLKHQSPMPRNVTNSKR